ncbi:tetracycline resistance protein [Arthrobacter sp. StoSoilB3]|uniref:MFS transporter n=1 Tax=Paenarthrobacter TaxID=1742992 RepID=UPI001668D691|nr:MFS transporter [Paenarthrobacter nicotinovorans]BCW40557.1 tetracycline resistance protein [Arthrobacter sp. StoSoilB3]MBP2396643.1 MFS family permease [Paenarthrobacter nicotinovorans]UKF01052.1 MFS transporter [Paenarthrobacter nicotinovorans]UKF05835.1 MFS transporter [Paenarthrobacter nicotinovorans]GGV27316.1 tetracycline resistance protein [Paenarthrobacter nicotinovorans]
MTTSPTTALDPQRVQRRSVFLLSASQLLSGVGNGATLSIGSLLAVDLSGSEAWAGSITTVLTLAAAIAALPLARLAEARGRRVGLVTGLVAAMIGALLFIVAVMARSFPVLILGAAFLGLGTAANLQARFAAVDLAEPEHRGRSLSTVVWAITIGAVAGPNLIQPGALVGQALGLPPIAGPFVFSAAGLLLAALLLFLGLRPDPLLLARRLASSAHDSGGTGSIPVRGTVRSGLRAVRSSPQALLALAAVIAAHGVMVAVMSMTPLHLQQLVDGSHAGHHGGTTDSTDALVIIGVTISLHIAGMFALSPVWGWLTDKAGRPQTIAIGHGLLLVAVFIAGFGQHEPTLVTAGLILLGLGWSAATIAGSTMLAESVSQDERVTVQGVSDTLMGAAGAIGGATSGLLLAWIGYQGLNVASSLVAAAVLALTLAMALRRRPGVSSR